LKKAIENLKADLEKYRRLAKDPDNAERMEVGRVSWLYVESRKTKKPRRRVRFWAVVVLFWRWLVGLLTGKP